MALPLLCRFAVFKHALLLAASCFLFSSGKGQSLERTSESLPTLLIHQVVEGPILDGNLSDPCWENSSLAKDFTQRQPDEGEPASERTEVRICRDATTLYLAVRCYDRKPEEIVATVMQRDATVKGDDYFFVLIDPYQRGRDGYYFRTNVQWSQR